MDCAAKLHDSCISDSLHVLFACLLHAEPANDLKGQGPYKNKLEASSSLSYFKFYTRRAKHNFEMLVRVGLA